MATVWPKLAQESQKTILICGLFLIFYGLPVCAQRCNFGTADGKFGRFNYL